MKQNKSKYSLREIFRMMNSGRSSMRGKLLLYLCFLVLGGSGILVMILIGMGVFTEFGRGLEQTLEVQLKNGEKEISERLEYFAGNGIRMSERLRDTLEREVLNYPYDIHELENNPERLEEMQESIYPVLENGLDITRASGVFAVFDATVNTDAPDAYDSRSGICLRAANVSSSNALENDIFLFRGTAELALKNQIQLHNRWNMEFNIARMQWYRDQLMSENSAEEYLWINRQRLKDTWEDGIFLSIPVSGSSGEHYGICGLEISRLLFRLSYPAVESSYGDMFTVMAPLEGDRLLISAGMDGAGDIKTNEDFQIEKKAGFNIYKGSENSYLGMHRILPEMHDEKGRQWAVAVVLSNAEYQMHTKHQRIRILTGIMVFILLMLLSSFVLSSHFVKPIVRGLEELRTGEVREKRLSSGISEIDALAEFLKKKEEAFRKGTGTDPLLPPDIEELFDRFIENSKKLTLSEKNILEYYIKGYEIADVPELACISLNTVRKHNRSIYEKLNVNSKDELQLYLDLLKRCKRIGELGQS